MYINQLDWADWFETMQFSAKLTELIQLLFQVSCSVTESIRFHKVVDWVGWLWGTGMIDLIELIQNIPKKANEFERFPKNVNEIESFSKNQHILSWLTDLIESFEPLFWHWVDSYVSIK